MTRALDKKVYYSADDYACYDGWLMLSRDISPERWVEIGKWIVDTYGAFSRNVRWWLGDWLEYGMRRWKNVPDWSFVYKIYSAGTVNNMIQTVRQWPVEERVSGLPFETHWILSWIRPLEKRREVALRVQIQKLSHYKLRLYLKALTRSGEIQRKRKDCELGRPPLRASEGVDEEFLKWYKERYTPAVPVEVTAYEAYKEGMRRAQEQERANANAAPAPTQPQPQPLPKAP